ncbi:MAG TPA: pyrophosphatase PpaX [Acholeplasmatales bacterium]|nr:pyrophosphatase PpaX [Acholeplasmatales bacterium]
MTMPRIDAVLFDLDGTLVDSIPLIADTLRKTLHEFFPSVPVSPTDIDAMIGPPLSATFARFTADPHVVDVMIERYRVIYKTCELDSIRIFPRAAKTLRELKKRGYRLGLVTTKFTASALPSLDHFGLTPLFDVIIGLETVKNHKPHPEPVLKALDAFPHGQAVMVGDTEGDLVAGRAAGILTCAVGWSHRRNLLLELKPDFWIDDYAELIPAIERYDSKEEF